MKIVLVANAGCATAHALEVDVKKVEQRGTQFQRRKQSDMHRRFIFFDQK